MKILVADDDTTTRLVLTATLRRMGHEVTAMADGAAALEAWRAGDFPLVISDWMMPEIDGPALCQHIRAEARSHYTYVILLTSLEGRGHYLHGMEAGADDFISKPFDQELLAARLKVAERILTLHEALRLEATRDRLTGLDNRGAIIDSLQQELHRAARTDAVIGVLLIDVDHFKKVNDSRGHLVGDTVLREVARRMQATLRPYDRIGRFGGEEFVILVTGGDVAQANVIAERVRHAISDPEFDVEGGAPLWITVSVGVAAAPGASVDPMGLLGAADRALYRAKENGRNRVEFEDAAPPPA